MTKVIRVGELRLVYISDLARWRNLSLKQTSPQSILLQFSWRGTQDVNAIKSIIPLKPFGVVLCIQESHEYVCMCL